MSYSSKGYCLFLIPVRKLPFKGETVAVQSNIESIDIGYYPDSDDDRAVVKLSLTLNDDKSLSLKVYQLYNGKFIKGIDLLKLKYVGKDNLGFVQYEIFYNNDNDYGFSVLWDAISSLIYNLVKEIYHNHKYHGNDLFLLNKPIPISQVKINLSRQINSFQIFCFEFYIDRLKYYSNLLTDRIDEKFNFNKSFLSNFKYLISFRKNFQLYKLRFEVLKLIGYITYLGAIQSSKHQNSINEIELFSKSIQHSNEELCNLSDSSSNIYSLGLGIIGVIVGIIGLFLGISSFYGSPDISDIEKIENQVEQLQTEHTKKVDNLNLKIDNFHNSDSLYMYESINEFREFIKRDSINSAILIEKLQKENKKLKGKLLKFQSRKENMASKKMQQNPS
jgi:hypothetical protein